MIRVAQGWSLNPPTWKDWVLFLSLIFSVGTALVLGGKVLGEVEAIKENQLRVIARLGDMQKDLTAARIEHAEMEGADALATEKMNNMQREIDDLKAKK